MSKARFTTAHLFASLTLLAASAALSAETPEPPSSKAVWPLPTTQANNQQLGTLFYTTTERVALVLGRTGDTLSEARTDIGVNGIVKRPEQKGMMWINGRKYVEGTAISSGPPPVISKSGIVLDDNPVRVGETIDLDSGQRKDFIPEGSVKVRRK